MDVWLNGRFLPEDRARVPALDRGLLHGDAVYDTWRTYGGHAFAVAAHRRRLAAATRLLGLPAPDATAVWEARTRALLRRNRLVDATVRLTITRGAAGQGLVPAARVRPTVLLTLRPLPPDLAGQQEHGIAAVLLPFPRNAARPWGAVKLVSQASAVLGRIRAARQRAGEGLYVTPYGLVTEGTTSNLFVVRRGRIATPPADGSILAGVTRDLVAQLAGEAGLAVAERPVSARTVAEADEVFVTSSSVEILPIVRLDGDPIGDGRPGPVTRRLQAAYRARVLRWLRRRAAAVSASASGA